MVFGRHVKVILAVDSIRPPLTGIGRYTWELARHFASPEGGLDAIRFYFAGAWVDDVAGLLDGQPVAPTRSRLPKWARSLPPVKAFQRWNGDRRWRDHLFHSPNYFLPDECATGIVTVHDLSVFKYPETHPVERLRHFERGFASTLARAAHLVTDSEFTRREVAEFFGWPIDNITAVPLGVPAEFRPHTNDELASPLAAYQLSAGGYGLSVSTLEPRKRIDRLIDAYAELPVALRTRYPLVLVGSNGWLNDDLHAKIRKGESEQWLRYLGFVPEAVLPALYAGARAFFMPSKYEGFGLPVLEALASGVPTLTSNVSSLPEVAGDAGWLVEPDDHDALRHGIERVLSDDGWRDAARARGLELARDATWARCARRMLAVYERFEQSARL